MARYKYSNNQNTKPWGAFLLAFILFGACILVVIKFPPMSIFLEIPVLLLMTAGIFLISAWAGKNNKWGWVVSLSILSLLIMSRNDWLNFLTFGAWLLIFGLISLIN